jgi:hypothetical protein
VLEQVFHFAQRAALGDHAPTPPESLAAGVVARAAVLSTWAAARTRTTETSRRMQPRGPAA